MGMQEHRKDHRDLAESLTSSIQPRINSLEVRMDSNGERPSKRPPFERQPSLDETLVSITQNIQAMEASCHAQLDNQVGTFEPFSALAKLRQSFAEVESILRLQVDRHQGDASSSMVARTSSEDELVKANAHTQGMQIDLSNFQCE